MDRVRVAALQMVSGRDLETNLNQARHLLEQAARERARIAVLPENFALFHTRGMRAQGELESGDHPPIRNFLVNEARRLGLWIVGGSAPMATRPDGSAIDGRVRATCWLVNDRGEWVSRYDKMHLFDAQVGDEQGRYRESDTFEPGTDIVVADTPAGKLGMAICYDLRFPELFRALADRGAHWVTLPSAFTWKTGQAHWEVLLRARAIENQLWCCGVNQGGQHDPKRRTWGHSMFVNPWGTITAKLDEGVGLLVGEVDLQMQAELREQMPVLNHRRL